MRPDPHRAEPLLDVGRDLALDPDQRQRQQRDEPGEDRRDEDHLRQVDERAGSPSRPVSQAVTAGGIFSVCQIQLSIIARHRSMQGMTTSSVESTATTSATRQPLTISGSAARFEKFGLRTRRGVTADRLEKSGSGS